MSTNVRDAVLLWIMSSAYTFIFTTFMMWVALARPKRILVVIVTPVIVILLVVCLSIGISFKTYISDHWPMVDQAVYGVALVIWNLLIIVIFGKALGIAWNAVTKSGTKQQE